VQVAQLRHPLDVALQALLVGLGLGDVREDEDRAAGSTLSNGASV
jgi:hypothetical protein